MLFRQLGWWLSKYMENKIHVPNHRREKPWLKFKYAQFHLRCPIQVPLRPQPGTMRQAGNQQGQHGTDQGRLQLCLANWAGSKKGKIRDTTESNQFLSGNLWLELGASGFYTVYIDVYWQRIFGTVQLNITPPMLICRFHFTSTRESKLTNWNPHCRVQQVNGKYL